MAATTAYSTELQHHHQPTLNTFGFFERSVFGHAPGFCSLARKCSIRSVFQSKTKHGRYEKCAAPICIDFDRMNR
ncbi:MAG TPA: hypothetical protein DDW52_06125 [Planctomycetaceae bacterium]|nr:hypothetical protein [Planctomycetaceae bacterium]